MKRVVLFTGPLQERLSLVSLYSICAVYLIVFYYFFSLEPGPASVLSDKMMRLNPFLGVYLTPIFSAAVITWITALSLTIYRLRRKRIERVSRTIVFLLLPPLAFVLLRALFTALLHGYGHTFHDWLYHNHRNRAGEATVAASSAPKTYFLIIGKERRGAHHVVLLRGARRTP